MKWDSILWNAEMDGEDDELRLSIDAKCTDIDERKFERLQDEGVEVTAVKIRPEERKTRTRQRGTRSGSP